MGRGARFGVEWAGEPSAAANVREHRHVRQPPRVQVFEGRRVSMDRKQQIGVALPLRSVQQPHLLPEAARHLSHASRAPRAFIRREETNVARYSPLGSPAVPARKNTTFPHLLIGPFLFSMDARRESRGPAGPGAPPGLVCRSTPIYPTRGQRLSPDNCWAAVHVRAIARGTTSRDYFSNLQFDSRMHACRGRPPLIAAHFSHGGSASPPAGMVPVLWPIGRLMRRGQHDPPACRVRRG